VTEGPIKIFFSYSRKDLDLRDELDKHLAALREAGRITTWHDCQLEPGVEWEPVITEKLNTADFILLLVSIDFIASRYCYCVELKQVIRRHEEGTARVIPIILRHCDWNHADVPFSRLNVLPDHARPVVSWPDRDEAFMVVARKIREMVDKVAFAPPPPPPPPPPPLTEIKYLAECNSAKLLFIKNVKDPNGWAYSIDRMERPESLSFELMWRSSSSGFKLPKVGDLMILHQRAKITHVVEFLDDQVRETDDAFFRWVSTVWIADQDWNQLPHQEDVLGFSPNYADGNTHSLNSPNFTTFRKKWNNLEDFQRHIFNRLTQSTESLIRKHNLVSDKGVDYARLRGLLEQQQWKEADQETLERMCEVIGQQRRSNFTTQDIQTFPCTDLQTIDQLWVMYSQGKFGFSVQAQLWKKYGSLTEASFNPNWEKFGEALGWKNRENWIDRSRLISSNAAPNGHFPSAIGFVSHGLAHIGQGAPQIATLASRLTECKIY